MRVNLVVIMIMSFGLYVVNSLYHPLVSMSFNDEEIKANVIYSEWRETDKELYKNIISRHTEYIIKKSKEKTELISEEDNNFVKKSKRKKELKFNIEDLNSFRILMKNYYKKDIDKAFKYVESYDKSYKKLNEKMNTTKKISNFFVLIGIFIAIVLWFRKRG